MARYPRRPVPPPLETNATPVVLAGVAVWAIAGAVLLLARHHVPAWWLWTCLAGLLIGGVVLGYETWRRHRRTTTPEPDPDPTSHPDRVH